MRPRLVVHLTCAVALCAGGLTTALQASHADQPPPIGARDVALSGASGTAASAVAVRRADARVLRVQDGDTVVVRLRNGSVRYVRILGIDTPETIQGQHECGGAAASRRMKALLPRGTGILMRADPDQPRIDRYHRLLRYVRRSADLLEVGQAQLSRGLAEVYVYRDGQFEKRAAYERVERSARLEDVGIWGVC